MASSSPPTICPWKFLTSDFGVSSTNPQRKSFVQALNGSVDIKLSQLPHPCVKGDALTIKISKDEYQLGLQSCRNNIHGRLFLSKGDAPIKAVELRAKLSNLWKPIGNWKMIPLGRGFFEFSFAYQDDLRSVWSMGAWNLKPGLLRLSQWSPDFNPQLQKQTHAQCWVRITGLPQEYWRYKLLFEIASAIGTPVSLDESTRMRVYGYYARVLVDLDLSGSFYDDIMVEREDFTFFVGIEYEKVPYFCTECQVIGHMLYECR